MIEKAPKKTSNKYLGMAEFLCLQNNVFNQYQKLFTKALLSVEVYSIQQDRNNARCADFQKCLHFLAIW
jgi:hypothetical protein